LICVGSPYVRGGRNECAAIVQPCQEKTRALRTDDLIKIITEDQLSEDCRNLVQENRCWKEALATSDCRPLVSADDNRRLEKVYSSVKFLCEDNIYEAKSHQKCFKDSGFSEVWRQCIRQSGRITCDANQVSKCVEERIKSTRSCPAAAREFAKDFVHKTLPIIPDCQGLRLKHFYNKFF